MPCDFLLDPDVYNFLNSEKGKTIIKLIDKVLPSKPAYSFHRENRYDYDWSWADKQIKK